MKWFIALLLVILILSNALWFYNIINLGVTLSYKDQKIYELDETRKQLMLMMPKVADKASKAEVIRAAGTQHIHEKDGCTWVGWIGLKFDNNNKLQSVSPSWNSGASDPCYP